jgi:hypothetical protein
MHSDAASAARVSQRRSWCIRMDGMLIVVKDDDAVTIRFKKY